MQFLTAVGISLVFVVLSFALSKVMEPIKKLSFTDLLKLPTLREGFLVGLSNPKTMVFFTAVLPGFVDVKQGNVMLQLLILGIIFEIIGVLSDSMYAIGAGLARDWFARDPKRIGIVQGSGGLMIVGLAIWVAFFDSL